MTSPSKLFIPSTLNTLFTVAHTIENSGLRFRFLFLLDIQANLLETSLVFVCQNGFGEHLFSNAFIVLEMYGFDLLFESIILLFSKLIPIGK